jgi:hypothetical protein
MVFLQVLIADQAMGRNSERPSHLHAICEVVSGALATTGRVLTAAPGHFGELQVIVSALMSSPSAEIKKLIIKVIPRLFAECSLKHLRLL